MFGFLKQTLTSLWFYSYYFFNYKKLSYLRKLREHYLGSLKELYYTTRLEIRFDDTLKEALKLPYLKEATIESLCNINRIESPKLIRLKMHNLDTEEELIINCPKLDQLNIDFCPTIQSLDLNLCPQLKYISLKNNKNISSIKIDKLKKVRELTIEDGKLNSLDLRNHKHLTQIECSHGQLKSLKVPSGVIKLHAFRNQLQTIELKHCSELEHLDLTGNKISNIILNSPNLERVGLRENKIKSISLHNQKEMIKLDLSHNQIKGEIDLSHLKINTLILEVNSLNKVILPLEVHRMDISENNIEELVGLENITELCEFFAYNNQLKNVTITSNKIYTLSLKKNPLEKLNIPDKKYSTLSMNPLTLNQEQDAKLIKILSKNNIKYHIQESSLLKDL